ncbi:MAG: hypothetical protein GYA55_03795 [SAR324 cluster bacterium]|uniref:Uncharacterized protein n=1 Tax=SAR324 cluster bacterium TaxID=2024889 RepID=A0A7X9FQ66_9DELT|nr:hypothetical protein [SAR324 cluster bacterium]
MKKNKIAPQINEKLLNDIDKLAHYKNPKKPVINVRQESRNIYGLLCVAADKLRKAGMRKQADEMLTRATNIQSSATWEFVVILLEYVELR